MTSKQLRMLALALCALLSAVLLSASAVAGPTKITVICSNDTVGTLEPCG